MDRKKQVGFTLLELMVVVAIIAVIMTVIMSIMANAFKANNRTTAMSKVNDNGSYALEQIRRYYLGQSVCDASALVVSNDFVLQLINSGTGETMSLTKKDEVLVNGGVSAECADGALNVGFTLSTGASKSLDYKSEKSFKTTVVLRN